MNKIIILVIQIMIASIVGYAQDKPKAILLTEMDDITCEMLLAELDQVLVELQKSPDSIGYAVIYSEAAGLRKEMYEDTIKAHVRIRGFEQDKLKVIRATGKTGAKIQLWLVPIGAEMPKFTKTKWDFTYPKGTKPFIFSSTGDNDGICSSYEYLRLNNFAERLEANPEARGNFVIKSRSNVVFNKEKASILKILVGKYKVSIRRLRFFHVRKKLSGYLDPRVRVWLLPNKKRTR